MNIVDIIKAKFGDPDVQCDSQYRAIMDLLESAGDDRQLAVSICEELARTASGIASYLAPHQNNDD